MQLTKVIITTNKNEKKYLIEKFNLKEIKIINNLIIFEWQRILDNKNEKIILLFTSINKNDLKMWIEYLFENFFFDKLINIWLAKNIWNFEMKIWDVVLPNTFLYKNETPFFLNYAIWENYDLNKFGLILNWVCVTWDENIITEKIKNEDYLWDIYDMESYHILTFLKQYDFLDKVVVIKSIFNENSDNSDNNEVIKSCVENNILALDLVL